MKRRKVSKFITSLLVLVLLAGLFPIGKESNLGIVKAATTLNNPRIQVWESFVKVTWDCVWFGAYPQSEVTSGDIYNTLKNTSGWDDNNDIVINGNKYRRLKEEDSTYVSAELNYYNWNGDSSYHYFKYEPIKWRVLKIDGEKILLLADEALDTQQYYNENASISWKSSNIRHWLNGLEEGYGRKYLEKNFINAAFFTEEKNNILETTDLSDKVFLLSDSQYKTKDYGLCDIQMKNGDFYVGTGSSKCSTYAYAMGCYRADEVYVGGIYWWIAKSFSPSYGSDATGGVDPYGYYDDYVPVMESNYGVRPALYLNRDSSVFSYAGTVNSDREVKEVPPPSRVYKDNTPSGGNSGNTGGNNQGNNGNSSNNNNDNNSGNSNNAGNNSNKNNTTTNINSRPSNTTTATKKPTKQVLLPVEKMTGSLKAVKSPKKSTLAIAWKKLSKITGYQVQFCAKRNFKKGTIERKFKKKVTKTQVGPLKSKKKYYVRIRPYTKSGSKMYYGKWSKVKSVKIK